MSANRRQVTRRTVLATLAGLPVLGRASAEVPSLGPGLVVNIRDFGARGDGRADDTPAFQAMHDHLVAFQRRHPQGRIEIRLPTGHYRYGWNQWLWGLRRVAVIGEGASLQCTSDSPWDVAKFALTTNADPFTAGRDAAAGKSRFGALIRSVDAGSRTVVLADPTEGKRFVPGRLVCVLSFDQQFGGYPPNCRYFDFAMVTQVGGGSVVLDRPLRFAHRDNNCEDRAVAESIGRARIAPVDRPGAPFALEQLISGVSFVANPHARDRLANVVQAVGFVDLEFRGCRLINLVSSIGLRCRVIDCELEFTEPDKLVAEMQFERCRIGRISQATGVHRLRLKDCRIEKRSDIQARYVLAEGCTFRGGSDPDIYSTGLSLDGFTPTRLIEVVDSSFVGKAGQMRSAVGLNPTVGALLTPPIEVAGGIIHMPLSDERARILLGNLEVGDVVLLGSVFAGTTFSDGRFGIVRAIASADGDAVIRTTAPLRRGDVLFTFRVRQARFLRNRHVNVDEVPPVSLDTDWEGRVEGSSRYLWTFTSGDFAQVILSCPGEIQQVSVDVRRPYRGPDAGAFLILTTRTPAFATIVLATDLKRPGLRTASVAEVVGVRRTDLWKPIPPETIVWDFYTHHSLTDNGWHRRPSGSLAQQAEYVLTVSTRPFWQSAAFVRERQPA